MGNAGQMQSSQVPSNQTFLNRPPGPIPVTHGNVQQQVTNQQPELVSAFLSFSALLSLHTALNAISVLRQTEAACCSNPYTSPLTFSIFFPFSFSFSSSSPAPPLSAQSLWWWAWLRLVRSQ